MTERILCHTVTHVNLGDNWRQIRLRSFTVSPQEYVVGDGAAIDAPLGFAYLTPEGDRITGPLSALCAVRRTPNDTPK